MAKIEIEAITVGGLTVTYRIYPAFLESGYRVFCKREWEKDKTCWDKIFATEEEALERVTKHLDMLMEFGTQTSLGILSYQVYKWEE